METSRTYQEGAFRVLVDTDNTKDTKDTIGVRITTSDYGRKKEDWLTQVPKLNEASQILFKE